MHAITEGVTLADLSPIGTMGVCSECGDDCLVVPLDNAFDAHGPNGNIVVKPDNYGQPVSHCCDAMVIDA